MGRNADGSTLRCACPTVLLTYWQTYQDLACWPMSQTVAVGPKTVGFLWRSQTILPNLVTRSPCARRHYYKVSMAADLPNIQLPSLPNCFMFDVKIEASRSMELCGLSPLSLMLTSHTQARAHTTLAHFTGRKCRMSRLGSPGRADLPLRVWPGFHPQRSTLGVASSTRDERELWVGTMVGL